MELVESSNDASHARARQRAHSVNVIIAFNGFNAHARVSARNVKGRLGGNEMRSDEK